MDSSPGLSRLQHDLLREFFARERRFVLTGGGALVGYHLHHRTSDDLDLFAKPPARIEEARRAVEAAAEALAATVESLRAADVDEPTEVADGVRIHSLREIAANKVCALVGRGEVRDLIDLRAMLLRGIDLRAALGDAERKDGGVSAATLAWILDQVVIGASAKLPGITGQELDAFRRELVKQLRAIARPDSA